MKTIGQVATLFPESFASKYSSYLKALLVLWQREIEAPKLVQNTLTLGLELDVLHIGLPTRQAIFVRLLARTPAAYTRATLLPHVVCTVEY